MYKGAAVSFAPGDSPNAGWVPLSKGTHKEPHGRLIHPAKYQYTNQIYDIGTEILYETCFGHNSTQIEALVTVSTSIESSRRALAFERVKT